MEFKMDFTVFVFAVLITTGTSAAVVDPCHPSIHALFPVYLGSRNEHCQSPATGSQPCDMFLIPGWYVTPEATILTHCPSRGDCGVSYPAWMNGSLPDVNDGIVSRKACLKQGPDCCSVHVDIEVKNCNGFFVYNLARSPDCYSVYCFESMLPCVEGAPISTEATTKAQSTTALSTTSGTSTPPRTSLNSKVTTEAAATQRPTTLTTKGQLKLPAVTRDQKEITDVRVSEYSDNTMTIGLVSGVCVLSVLLVVAGIVIAKFYWCRPKTGHVYETKTSVGFENDARPTYEELNFQRNDGGYVDFGQKDGGYVDFEQKDSDYINLTLTQFH